MNLKKFLMSVWMSVVATLTAAPVFAADQTIIKINFDLQLYGSPVTLPLAKSGSLLLDITGNPLQHLRPFDAVLISDATLNLPGASDALWPVIDPGVFTWTPQQRAEFGADFDSYWNFGEHWSYGFDFQAVMAKPNAQDAVSFARQIAETMLRPTWDLGRLSIYHDHSVDGLYRQDHLLYFVRATSVEVIPEPETNTLMLSGLGVLAATLACRKGRR